MLRIQETQDVVHVVQEKSRPSEAKKLFTVNDHTILLRGFEFVYASFLRLECRGISVVRLF